MRVFLDTNVLVSAFTARGLCADLFRYLVATHEVLVGEVNLVELRRTLTAHFRASEGQIDFVVTQLRDQTVVPRPDVPNSIPVRDPDDAWVLASALVGQADILVTDDKDLLAIASTAPIPVFTPRATWERLRQGD